MKRTLVIIVVMMAVVTCSYADPISQQWVKVYSGEVGVNIILQTIDGGYIGVGLNGNLVKFDCNGDISWQKNYSIGNYQGEPSFIQQTSDGGYIAGGSVTPIAPYDPYQQKSWLIKYA